MILAGNLSTARAPSPPLAGVPRRPARPLPAPQDRGHPPTGRFAPGCVSPGWGTGGGVPGREDGRGGHGHEGHRCRGAPTRGPRLRRRLRAGLSSRLRRRRGRRSGGVRESIPSAAPPPPPRPPTPPGLRGAHSTGMPGGPGGMPGGPGLAPAASSARPAPAAAGRARTRRPRGVPAGPAPQPFSRLPSALLFLPPTAAAAPGPRGPGSPRLTSAGQHGAAHTRACRVPSGVRTHRVRLARKPVTCR